MPCLDRFVRAGRIGFIDCRLVASVLLIPNPALLREVAAPASAASVYDSGNFCTLRVTITNPPRRSRRAGAGTCVARIASDSLESTYAEARTATPNEVSPDWC